MATNRPYDLDEAMHRRIMLAIEFRQPDHILRKTIWEAHIPQQMQLADDVDLNALALRFELTGGFIKNAILSALSIAVSRDGDAPTVCHEDLLRGANLQLRGRLRMKDFHRRLIPARGLDQVIIPDPIMKNLKEIIQFEKARSVLFGQWGFDKTEQQGLTVLFHGLPGTGKSLAAEAVGYEVGKPLKLVNCGELLSKWVGESTKNIDSIFEEARSTDAILVFDEAEGLFGQRTDMKTSTDRYANVDVGVLLYHIERFPGIIILTTNLIDNMDKAFFRRLKFVLHFDTPSFDLRKKLWKLLIPGETPLEDGGVDYDKLAHYEMSGGDIKSFFYLHHYYIGSLVRLCIL
jgi:SpoVK/Ycf46/Vps4 family AAA+-type ATPase